MARGSLGKYWAQRSDAEKKDFVPLFTDLIEQAYMSKIEDYSGEVIRYRGETVDGNYGVRMLEVESAVRASSSLPCRPGSDGLTARAAARAANCFGVPNPKSFRISCERL